MALLERVVARVGHRAARGSGRSGRRPRMRRSSSSASASETVRSWPWKASCQCSAGHLRTCSSSSATAPRRARRSSSSSTISGSVSKRHGYASRLPGLPGQICVAVLVHLAGDLDDPAERLDPGQVEDDPVAGLDLLGHPAPALLGADHAEAVLAGGAEVVQRAGEDPGLGHCSKPTARPRLLFPAAMADDLTRRGLIRRGAPARRASPCSELRLRQRRSGGALQAPARPPERDERRGGGDRQPARDHIYGPRARTDALDCGGRGPALHAAPSRRGCPRSRRAARSWRATASSRSAAGGPSRGLPAAARLGARRQRRQMWTEYLREQGWTTGYVTDNPHILSAAQASSARRFDRVELVYGQVPQRARARARSPRQSSTSTCRPSSAARAPSRGCSSTCASTRAARDEEDYNAARVFKQAMTGSTGRAPGSRSRS